jgi:hypothetical protein
MPVLDEVLAKASADIEASVSFPADATVVAEVTSVFSKRCSEDI